MLKYWISPLHFKGFIDAIMVPVGTAIESVAKTCISSGEAVVDVDNAVRNGTRIIVLMSWMLY